EDGVPLRVPLALEEELRELAPRRRRHAAVPLDECDELEPARGAALVRQPEAPVLGRRLRIDEERPLRADAAERRAERRGADPVPALEAVVGGERRRGGERPRLPRLDVPEPEEAPGGVARQVLLPA